MRATCVHQNGSAQRIIEAVEEVEGSQLPELITNGVGEGVLVLVFPPLTPPTAQRPPNDRQRSHYAVASDPSR